MRLNAEDPRRDFAPFPCTVADLRVPGGPGVRFESMLYAGYTVPPFYDSLLAKLVVHAETREAAITRLVRALSETRIDGLRTTKPLFLALADDPAVQANVCLLYTFDVAGVKRVVDMGGRLVFTQ